MNTSTKNNSHSEPEKSDNDKNLSHKFQRFFKLTSVFRNSSTPVSADNATLIEQKKAIEEQANQILVAKALIPFAKLVSNGYEPTAHQNNLFNQTFSEWVDKDEWSALAELIKCGHSLNASCYCKLMLDCTVQKKCLSFEQKTDTSEFMYIQNGLKQASENSEYNITLFKQFRKKMESLNQIFNISYLSVDNINDYYKEANILNIEPSFEKVIPFMVQEMPLSEYSKTISWLTSIKNQAIDASGWNSEFNFKVERINKVWQNICNSLLDYMTHNLEHHFSSQLDTLMSNTQAVYMDSYLAKKAGEESVKNSQSYNMGMLPQNEKNLVENIRLQYETLLPHYAKLNEEDQFNLKTLVQEKLPKYINDFLSMKEEYRTTMVNAQGKNAQALLNESLANISENLQQIDIRLNENNLKELSVGAKYTKAKMN
jgi:hypothetical protein